VPGQEGRRLVFLHIPRTGGTRLAKALTAGWPRLRIVQDFEAFTAIPPEEAAEIDAVAGGFLARHVDLPRLRGFTPLTLLRDPRERLELAYRHARASALRGEAAGPQVRFAGRAGFAEYAFSIHGLRDRHLQLHRLAAGPGQNPLDLTLDELLERAKARLDTMEVGTTDRLQAFADHLFRRFGRPVAPALGGPGATGGDDAPLGLTAAQETALRELTAPDRALVDYGRAVFEARAEALASGRPVALPRPRVMVRGTDDRPRMLVGTFHKTGTILIRTIMETLGRRLRRTVWRAGSPATPPAHWDIWFDPNSTFPAPARDRPYRAVVVVRDPRDVIISGAYYHATTERPGDRWVDTPLRKLGGRSYKQHINALPDDAARFLFEMSEKGRETIGLMSNYIEPDADTLVLKYEQLVTDTRLEGYRNMFRWLGFTPSELGLGLDIARDSSLFSGPILDPHVRSGAPEQWRQHFTPDLLAAFRERFGDIAERLGYPSA
jgi:hypothetical protein